MIVGSGLIAKAFMGTVFDSPHYTVFASGVSNSTEDNDLAYNREVDLLQQYVNLHQTIIYFSTISIYDPSRFRSRYIQHKIQIEALIEAKCSSYLIIRLPILVGRSDNPHTLMNYLVNAIESGEVIELHKNACRYLLDIDDVVPLLTKYSSLRNIKKVLNVPGSTKISIPVLVSSLETILKKRGNWKWISQGSCYDIPGNQEEVLYIDELGYIDKILNKYYSHQSNNLEE